MTQLVKSEKKTQGVGALAVMASRFNVEPAKLLGTLKATVFKEARNDEEMMGLCIVANEYGLNPLIKEIYAFPAKGGGIVPVVSIDGWIRIINSHPQMDGIDFEIREDDNGAPVSCTAIIYRKDRSRPVKVTEFLSECQRNTDPWKMKHRMLRHKALIQCARVAFGFGGIYDEDEANDIKSVSGKVIEKPLFKASTVAEIEAPAEPEGSPGVILERATPHETLANLMKSSRVDETSLLAFVRDQSGDDYASVYDLDQQMVAHLIKTWVDIVDHITAGGAA